MKQIVTVIATLSAFLVGITTIVLSVIGDFGGSRGTGVSPQKMKEP